MRRRFPTFLALLCLTACGGGAGDDRATESPPADTAAADETAGADSVRIVLVPGPLRVHPASGAASVTDVSAGTTLRATGDTTVGSDRWVRLTTWDDRSGWMPRGSVLDAALWSHYSTALGGVALVSLRPAYPAGDGRWVAEAPFPSPDLDPPAEAWLVGESLHHARVAGRDTMRLECIDARHSLAVLDRPDRAPERPGVRLEEGMLAIPSAREPTARALAVAALDPEPELRDAVEAAARAALEAGPPGGVPDHADAPPPEAGAEPALDRRTVGPDAAWAVAFWNPHEGESADILPGRWGTAVLAVRAGDGWATRTVLPLAWTFAGPTAPPWRLLSAVATVPDRPTLLAVEIVEYEGARIDLHLADDAGFRRFYRGFYWGC